jgi:hypothetical protein
MRSRLNISRLKHLLLSITLAAALFAALLFSLGLAAPATQASAGAIFVQPDGAGAACSQARPCSLPTALAQAAHGDIIYLAQGIYTGSGDEAVDITRSVTLAGGWDGTATTPPHCDPSLYPSMVDGEGIRRGLTISGPLSVTLQGFTVANGVHSLRGAGLYANSVDLTLRQMTFTGNLIDSLTSGSPYGGGAAVERGTLQVEDSSFIGNSVWGRHGPEGGGLIVSRTLEVFVENTLFQANDAWVTSGLAIWGSSSPLSTVVVRGCRFLDNGWGFGTGHSSGGYYGALAVSESHALVEDNRFVNNWTGNGRGAVAIFRGDLQFDRNTIVDNSSRYDASGLYLYGVSPYTLTNNLIAGNESVYSWVDDDAAVQIESGSGRLLHNTIARNGNDYGLRIERNATVALTNTILVSHSVGISLEAGSTLSLEATLWGGAEWANGQEWSSAGTITHGAIDIREDPGFRAAEHGDFHLGPGSAAADRGVDAGVAIDIDGEPRPLAGGYDIGADEWDPAEPPPTITATPTLTPTPTPRPTSTPTPVMRPRMYLPVLVRPS